LINSLLPIFTDLRLPLLCRNSISLFFDLSMWNSIGNKETSTRDVFTGSYWGTPFQLLHKRCFRLTSNNDCRSQPNLAMQSYQLHYLQFLLLSIHHHPSFVMFQPNTPLFIFYSTIWSTFNLATNQLVQISKNSFITPH
jgi:hypothetical protein